MSFERHGIRHLSASSLNLFRAEPSLWTLKYLFGVRDRPGPAASRGTAVEAALNAMCVGMTKEMALSKGIRDFLNEVGEIEDVQEHVRHISDMIDQLQLFFRFELDLHKASLITQKKVELHLDGIEVPVVGYIDYLRPDCLFDLKTTLRLPSEPRPEHVRQMAIYSAVENVPAKLVYVTPKKHAVYTVPESLLQEGLAEVRRIARNLQKVLQFSATKEDVAEFYTPDYTSFYWNEETITKAKEVFV